MSPFQMVILKVRDIHRNLKWFSHKNLHWANLKLLPTLPVSPSYRRNICTTDNGDTVTVTVVGQPCPEVTHVKSVKNRGMTRSQAGLQCVGFVFLWVKKPLDSLTNLWEVIFPMDTISFRKMIRTKRLSYVTRIFWAKRYILLPIFYLRGKRGEKINP